MLAPLEDRSTLEREPPAEAGLARANAHLRMALNLARREHKRAAAAAAKAIERRDGEIDRLRQLLDETGRRLEALESGRAIVALGQRLMQLSERNDALMSAAQRLWTLDRTLGAARAECQRLARERDGLAARLAAHPGTGGNPAKGPR